MTALADREARIQEEREAATGGPDGGARDELEATREAAASVRIRWLGHATALVDLPGVRLLTDPFLRDGLGLLRRHGPIPSPAAIGPIDVVLISHGHPDHFDRQSLQAIDGNPLVIVPRGLGDFVQRAGLRAREVVVDEPVAIAPGVSVMPVRARHWPWLGAPRSASVGYLIEGPGRHGVYFAGDTSRFGRIAELAERVDIALLPVGKWGPHPSPGHLDPKSAAEVARDLRARYAIPIHWGTLYPRGLDRVAGRRLREPARRFAEWARQVAPDVDVVTLPPGTATTIRLPVYGSRAATAAAPRTIANQTSRPPRP